MISDSSLTFPDSAEKAADITTGYMRFNHASSAPGRALADAVIDGLDRDDAHRVMKVLAANLACLVEVLAESKKVAPERILAMIRLVGSAQ